MNSIKDLIINLDNLQNKENNSLLIDLEEMTLKNTDNDIKLLIDSRIEKAELIFDDVENKTVSGVILEICLKDNKKGIIEITGCDLYDSKCKGNIFNFSIKIIEE